MYNLIQNSDIRWPNKIRHGVEVSLLAQDLISKVIFSHINQLLSYQDQTKQFNI